MCAPHKYRPSSSLRAARWSTPRMAIWMLRPRVFASSLACCRTPGSASPRSPTPPPPPRAVLAGGQDTDDDGRVDARRRRHTDRRPKGSRQEAGPRGGPPNSGRRALQGAGASGSRMLPPRAGDGRCEPEETSDQRVAHARRDAAGGDSATAQEAAETEAAHGTQAAASASVLASNLTERRGVPPRSWPCPTPQA